MFKMVVNILTAPFEYFRNLPTLAISGPPKWYGTTGKMWDKTVNL